MDNAKRVMNGTFGEVWLNGEYVAECFKLQAKESYTREDVPLGLVAGKKLVKIERTGSMGLHKVNSRMAIQIGDEMKAGRDPRFTVISALDDPDAYGAERISLIDVAFDDLTFADWEKGVKGRVEAPFSFMDYEFLDRIGA